MPQTVAFTTLGCRLNQAESDSMAEELANSGVISASDGEHPDVVVINTCTVTKEATKASRSAIRRAIRSYPDAKVVVAGCYAVSDPDEVNAIAGVDLLIGNDDKERFAEVLEASRVMQPVLQIGGIKTTQLPYRVRANLKVQTGCDEWCTFCIIPKTRGPLRSMDENRLLSEARAKVAAGARELVLTGVHLGKYTFDSGGDERLLIRLFQRLLEIDGVWRLRLSSILSQHLTEEVLAFMRDEPRMCRFLHVPLQAGHDSVLTAMHRPYDIAGFMDSIARAKGALPGLALATDIIVGFPGETDEAFEATLDVVRKVGFSKLHVFRYSARHDTPAASMADEVHPDIKRERSKRLIELGNEIRSKFLAEHLARPIQILVEDERTVDGITVCSGQTDDFVRVWFEADGLLGSLVEIEGDEVRADGIRGGRVLQVLRRG